MILELDIGNTLIKWRRLQADGSAAVARGAARDLGELRAGPVNDGTISFLRLCSVRGEDSVEQVRQWAAERWNLQARVARVTRSEAGVTVHYPDLTKLGIDRWLAMLAAFHRARGACVIVDGGTALTIDALAADGQHLGGYILPGLNLMRASLEANTRIRLAPGERSPTTAPGHSTEEAVLNGALAAAVALIERTREALCRGRDGVKLYFSGGDGALLLDNCQAAEAELLPELVLDGLAIACPLTTDREATGTLS